MMDEFIEKDEFLSLAMVFTADHDKAIIKYSQEAGEVAKNTRFVYSILPNGAKHGKCIGFKFQKNYRSNSPGKEYKYSEENYVFGELDGQKRSYMPNGRLWVEMNYSKGKKHGKNTVWFDVTRGRAMKEHTYHKGKLHGKGITYWGASGIKKDECDFVHGRLNGKVMSWYENGQMAEEAVVKNNVITSYKSWFENGIMREAKKLLKNSWEMQSYSWHRMVTFK